MAKRTKKKRDKKYTGEDARVVHKTVTRVSAPERSRFGNWWHDNKQSVAFRGVLIGLPIVLIGIVWLIWQLIRFIF
ncbi:MAG: hypothetical protein R3313_04075 [Candidatus Saccharimonadales bacterium]|nr:hypothetical protein [Candidatus Saccharimonadales bacterium]